jgi:hypothetical protein
MEKNGLGNATDVVLGDHKSGEYDVLPEVKQDDYLTH